MCWGYGGGGVCTSLAEMSLPGWLKPLSAMAQVVLPWTEGERALPDPISVTFPINTSQFKGNFLGNITKWQQVLEVMHNGWNKRSMMWIFVWKASGSSWTLLYLFFWSTKSLPLWAWAHKFMWCGTARRPQQCKAESGPVPLPHPLFQWAELGRETQLSAFSSAFLPRGSHNSLFSCCLGLTLLHIPKHVKSKSGSRKDHGKNEILGCYFCRVFWNSRSAFLWKSPFSKSQPCTHNLQHMVCSILSCFDKDWTERCIHRYKHADFKAQ